MSGDTGGFILEKFVPQRPYWRTRGEGVAVKGPQSRSWYREL
jgi:hypothetical protein